LYVPAIHDPQVLQRHRPLRQLYEERLLHLALLHYRRLTKLPYLYEPLRLPNPTPHLQQP
jgi:hypothetical protein